MKNKMPKSSLELVLDLKPDKWKGFIVKNLLTGAKRFGELQNAIEGISSSTLTNSLKQLESVGIVKRKSYSEIPPRVEYSLTEIGQKMEIIVNAVETWTNEYIRYFKKDDS